MNSKKFGLLFSLTTMFSIYSSWVQQTVSKLIKPTVSIMARQYTSGKALNHLQQITLMKEIKEEQRKRFLKTTAWATVGIAASTPVEIAGLIALSNPIFELCTTEICALSGAWLASQTVPLWFGLRSHQKSTEKICNLKNKLIL